MPLDLNSLSKQLIRLAEYASQQAPSQTSRLDLAVKTLRARANDHEDLAALVGARTRRPFRAAVPRGCLDETVAAVAAPAAYSVVATDGSQIEPDRHGPVLCHLVNVGAAVLEYGPDSHAVLTSESRLNFEPSDVFISPPGRERMLVQERLLSLKRHVAETARLADLLEARRADAPVVGLQDGTLLLSAWGQGGETEVLQPILDDFLRCLDRMRAAGQPIASYISRPRGSDVVNLLRLAICRVTGQACDTGACADQAAEETGCGALAGFPDRAVFEVLLNETGARSAVFGSSWAASRDHYREHQIHFFYLNVGAEIARVEVPRWVAEDPAMLALVQSIVLDQCERGQGYPRSLIEAHEKAVITAADSRLYASLIEGTLVGRGIALESSAKALSKRLRSV
jgi:GNAT superfamily N-acetyltransferase